MTSSGDSWASVGMVGAGQLAQMTARAAIDLGIRFGVLAESPDESAARVTAGVALGAPGDAEAVLAFARRFDVVTFDHEHVPGPVLRTLEDAGLTVRPGSAALHFAQDKIAMRERLSALGLPVPAFRPLAQAADLGLPVVVKAARGGYDGRGVWVVERAADLPTDDGLYAEAFVPFRRELAALVARSPSGQVAAYPVVETVQRDGICVEVLAPAPGLPEATAVAAQELAVRAAEALGVTGLLAVELFETDEGLLVNELAMRPHNSGHWTMEGARTGQFAQHLRAVLDLPLGDPSAVAQVTVMANVLAGRADERELRERLTHVLARDPGVAVHLYGKAFRPGRKVGHVTAVGSDLHETRARAAEAAVWLRGERS